MVNSSHCRLDAFVVRAVAAGDDCEARRFSTWAPMAIASIGRVASTIADQAGGNWPQRARAAALALSQTDEDADTIGVMLLEDIKAVFADIKAESLWTEDLLRHLHAMSERPWGEYGRQRKQITSRQLGGLLKPFKIESTQIWKPEAKANKHGYRLEQFSAAWNRYLSAKTLESAETAGFGAFPSASAGEPLAERNLLKAGETAGSSALADRDTETAGARGNGHAVACAYCREPIETEAGGYSATSCGKYLHNGCLDLWSSNRLM